MPYQTKSEQTLLDEIAIVLGDFFHRTEAFIPGQTPIRLAEPAYDEKEVLEVISCLLSKNLTLNQKASGRVMQFENLWAEYIGAAEAVMVNSGSSANLLALNVLSNPLVHPRIDPGDEIITPALTWSTTVSPILNIRAVPVLLDVQGPDDLTIDVSRIEEAITSRTKAIMPVHLLGAPCDMKEIQRLASKYGLYVIEDCCEAHGAELDGRRVGSFGDIATFSFFFSHHLTTIEGGMLLTGWSEFAEIARTMRSQGVMRNVRSQSVARKYEEEYPDVHPSFLFANIGFNLRPTELQGAFGLEQFKKFPEFLIRREENCFYYKEALAPFADVLIPPRLAPNTRHAWFAYPIVCRPDAPFQAKELQTFLESRGVETRPVMSGDFTRQPLFKLFPTRVPWDLRHTRMIHRNAFFFGNHPGIGRLQREYIVECVAEFVGSYSSRSQIAV